MAPILVSVWKVWTNLSKAEVKACKDKVLTISNFLSKELAIANAFFLAHYDHHKCTTTFVMIHTK